MIDIIMGLMDANATPAVIFDFDGTIADSFFLVAEGYKQFAQELGIKSTTNFDLQELRSFSAKEIVDKYKISYPKIWKVTPKIWKFMHERLNTVKPVVGIAPALKILWERKYRMYVITSNSKNNAEYFLQKNDLNFFENIYSIRSLFGKDKALKKVIKAENLTLRNVLYIGDEARDVEAAKKAGIGSVAVTWGFNNRKALMKSRPDIIVDNPEELVKEISGYWSAAV